MAQHKARAATITRRKVQHMEEGYRQMGTVLTDQRPEHSDGDGVIVVGRFKGGPYDGVQLSYVAGQRNLYLTPEAALRLAILLAAAAEAASPSTSTAMCRLRPFTFLALSQPRLARGTVSAARTDWESITAADGSGSRPAAARARARSTSCSRAKVPSSRQAAKYPYTVSQGVPGRHVPPGRTDPHPPADAIDQPAFGPFRRTTWLLRLRQQRLQHTAHCASLRSNRPVTARVATRSPDNWSSWSKNHLPETSLLIDERHTSTGRLPRILLNTA